MIKVAQLLNENKETEGFEPSSQWVGGHVGSLATIYRKPRQVRKEATVVIDSGAEDRLAWLPHFKLRGSLNSD